jgi:hypothetical protein
MGKRLRYILVLLSLATLSLPMMQQTIQFWEEKPLNGIGNNPKNPTLCVKNWLNGTYQDSLSRFVTTNIGFHHDLVRLNNQLYYSLYRTAQANKVVIGKENCLYDQVHIDSYLGKDYIGQSAIYKKIAAYLALRNLLKKKDITLLLVVVPGKGTALSDFLPANQEAKIGPSNYEVFANGLDSLHVPYLDLVKWYQQVEGQSKYPLYALGGNHWSEYCGTLAGDTLLGFMEMQLHAEINRYHVRKVNYPVAPSPIDDDINLGMNLLLPIQNAPMAYPEIEWQGIPRRFRVLSVGDSFYFKAFTELTVQSFQQSHFWFYFRELYLQGQEQPFTNDKVDLLLEVESQDVILLYLAEPHLTDLGFGFIEQTLAAYHAPEWRKTQLQRIINDIQKDSQWMVQIADKAKNQGVSFDSMLLKDAVWVLENSRIPR